MIKKSTKFFVGLFVASGTILALIAIIWLGMSNIFNKGQRFAVYFDESVQGLNVDAPVKYRGVSVGRVESISVAADSHLIQVVLELEPHFVMKEQVLAQLRVVGITGNMFIELDRQESGTTLQPPVLNFPTEFPVIASRPSEIKELFHDIDLIVEKITQIDIVGLTDKMEQTITHLDQAIQGADTAGISKHLKSSLDRIDSTVEQSKLPEMVAQMEAILRKFDTTLDAVDLANLSQEAKETLKSLQTETTALMTQAQPVLTNADHTLSAAENGIATLNQHMIVVGQQLEQATAKLNTLLDRINDQPSQLLFGEPPPRRLDE